MPKELYPTYGQKSSPLLYANFKKNHAENLRNVLRIAKGLIDSFYASLIFFLLASQLLYPVIEVENYLFLVIEKLKIIKEAKKLKENKSRKLVRVWPSCSIIPCW